MALSVDISKAKTKWHSVLTTALQAIPVNMEQKGSGNGEAGRGKGKKGTSECQWCLAFIYLTWPTASPCNLWDALSPSNLYLKEKWRSKPKAWIPWQLCRVILQRGTLCFWFPDMLWYTITPRPVQEGRLSSTLHPGWGLWNQKRPPDPSWTILILPRYAFSKIQ